MEIAYHATSLRNANKIFSEGVIRRTDISNMTHGKTTTGFVYLTKDYQKAFDFGNRSWGATFLNNEVKPEPVIVILKVDISGYEKYADLDEIIEEYGNLEVDDYSAEESIQLVGSFRIREDVDLKQRGIEYTTISFVPTKMSDEKYYNKFLDEDKQDWKDFESKL